MASLLASREDCPERKVLTFPSSLRDVNGCALLNRLDRELDVPGCASSAGRGALALLDRTGNTTADLELGNVHGMEVQCTNRRQTASAEDDGAISIVEREGQPGTYFPPVHLTFETVSCLVARGAALTDEKENANAKMANRTDTIRAYISKRR